MFQTVVFGEQFALVHQRGRRTSRVDGRANTFAENVEVKDNLTIGNGHDVG